MPLQGLLLAESVRSAVVYACSYKLQTRIRMGANKSIEISKKKNDNDDECFKKTIHRQKFLFPCRSLNGESWKTPFFSQAEWYLRFGAEYTILSLKIEEKNAYTCILAKYKLLYFLV